MRNGIRVHPRDRRAHRRSQDAGQTLRRFDKAQVHGTIMSVALHPTDPNQVYLGARYQGEVFGTQDGGKT